MQRLALNSRQAGRPIGFVPTMGYLHEGHLRLVQTARKKTGAAGLVVVSIYVNPTQFAPNEDLSKYPRDFERDKRLCREAGVDVIYLPSDEEMYPGRDDGRYSTYVDETILSRGMEGASRPTHFRGVATVVTKLFNIVQPTVAVFGQKDFQQAAVVRRVVADLNQPVKIVVAPTHREPDGLAMSSRNKYLNAAEREQAVALSRALLVARAAVKKRRMPAARLKERVVRFIGSHSLASLDYVEVFDPKTLTPVKTAGRGDHMALAVRFGKTRLIDNGAL